MASSYGPYIVSPAAWQENATDEDEWAHEFLSFEAVGTGPYRLVENTVNERIVFERFEDSTEAGRATTFPRLSCESFQKTPPAGS